MHVCGSISCIVCYINVYTFSYISYDQNSNPVSSSWCFKRDLPCLSGQRCKKIFKFNYNGSSSPIDIYANLFPVVLAVDSLFINCGGERVDDYQEDRTAGGPSYFSSSDRWAYSLTGSYRESTSSKGPYIQSSDQPSLRIFQTARIAPISLKYYGRCLRQGSYKVTLHFAEIMFTDDQTYSSLGRRIFDISIQVSI